jgi:general stress protein YciG
MITKEQRRAMGRKGGSAQVPKGFAMMDKDKLKELSSKGGKISSRRKR